MYWKARSVSRAAVAALAVAGTLALAPPAGAQSDSPSPPPEPPTIATAFGEFRCDDKQSEEVKRSPICQRWEKELAAWRRSTSGETAPAAVADEVRDQLRELCVDPASSDDQEAKLAECHVAALQAGYRTGILEPLVGEPDYQFEESGEPSVGIVGVRRHGRGGRGFKAAFGEGGASGSCPEPQQRQYQCVGVGRVAERVAAVPGTAVTYLVVVNANNPYSGREAAMRTAIKSLFLRDQIYWPDAGLSVPLVRPRDNAAFAAFVKDVLGMTLDELASHWRRLERDTGTTPPAQIGSARELLGRVARNQGAFSVIAEGEARKLPAKVRVLFKAASSG
jgi:hypothetical protein